MLPSECFSFCCLNVFKHHCSVYSFILTTRHKQFTVQCTVLNVLYCTQCSKWTVYSAQCSVYSLLLYTQCTVGSWCMQRQNKKYNGTKETLSSCLLREVPVECRETVEAQLKYRESSTTQVQSVWIHYSTLYTVVQSMVLRKTSIVDNTVKWTNVWIWRSRYIYMYTPWSTDSSGVRTYYARV